MARGTGAWTPVLLLVTAAGQPSMWGPCDPAECLDLRFLWTSRLEGRYLPVTSSGATCDPDASQACFGGAARRATYVEQARNASTLENQSVVFMDLGGSTFLGPLNGHPDFPLGTPEAILRNMTPYDVCAFGGRDFMVTADPKQMAEMPASYATHACPTVVSNAKLTGLWEAFGNKTRKYVVKTMPNGWKVGFLGMIPYSQSIGFSYGAGAVDLDRGSMLAQVASGAFKGLRVNGTRFKAEVDELQAEFTRMGDHDADVFVLTTVESVDTLAVAEELRAAHPDVKVLVLLMPVNDRGDQTRWMAQNGPFDVILRESWPLLGSSAEVAASEVYGKPVLIAGCETPTGLGSMHVRFRLGRGVERYVFEGNVPLNSSVPSDTQLQAEMSSLYAFTRIRNKLPYGVLTNPLVGGHRNELPPALGQCYWTDCSAGSILGRAFLWKARSLGYKASLSLSNLGGLRAPLTGDTSSTVYISHCQRTQAFQDVLGLYTILGKDLLVALKALIVPQERGFIGDGVRAAFYEPCFPYVNHTNYSYVFNAPPGSPAELAKCAEAGGVENPNVRVIDIQIQQVNWDNCKDYTKCEDFTWMQLQKGTTYTIVTRQYLATTQFAGFNPLGLTVGTDAQALCDYIAASSPLHVDSWEAYRDRGSVQYATPEEGWAAGNRVPSVKTSEPVLDSAPTCQDGMYLDDRAKSCMRCPAGTHSAADAARQSCEPCALGFFGSGPGLPRCTACPAGFFSEQAGSSGCKGCPAGSFSDLGAIYCNDCRAGTYAASMGSDTCRLCPRGNFAAAARATACAACLAGFVTYDPGARSASECICPAGTYRAIEVKSRDACVGANLSQAIGDGGACAVASSVCTPCPEGMVCDAGSDLRNYRPGSKGSQLVRAYPLLQPRFWSDPSAPLIVYRCATSLQCPGGQPGACANEDTIGLSCASCSEQHYATPEGCKPCRRVDAAPMVVVFIAAVALAGLLTSVSLADTDCARFSLITVALTSGQLVCAVQMMGVFRDFSIPWEEPLASLMELAGLVAFKVHLLKPECFLGKDSPIFIFVVRLLVLPVLGLIIGMLMFLVPLRASVLRFDCDRFQNGLGLLFVMLYVSITVSMVDPLQCTVHPNGKSSMSSNFSVLCWETLEHRALVAMSIVGFVCYPLAMLTRVAVVTWRYPSVVASGGGLRLLRRFRFLFARFRPECHFWGFLYLLRNLLLPLVPVVVPDSSLWQIFLAGLLLHACCYFQAALSPWKTPSANKSEVVSLVGLLIFIQTASFLSESGTRADGKAVSVLLFYVIVVTLASVVAMLLFGVARYVWPGKQFHIFLSHHKEGAGSLARWWKLQLSSLSYNVRVFLDSDELDNLEFIVEIVRSRTRHMVVLLTKMTLTRIWCAAEIASARAFNVGMHLVTCSDYVPPDEDFINSLGVYWSRLQQQVLLQYGVPMDHIKDAYQHVSTSASTPFDRYQPTECQQKVVRLVLRAYNGALNAGVDVQSPASTATTIASTWKVAFGQRTAAPTAADAVVMAAAAAAVSEGPRILIAGAASDPEARSACEVMRILVERKAGSTAATMYSCKVADVQWLGVEFLLVLLSCGLLTDPSFVEVAHAYMEARSSGRDGPLSLVAALADTHFPFPALDFYATLEDKILAAFLRMLFDRIAVPFSPHASSTIMDVQVQMLCKRFQHQPHLVEAAQEVPSETGGAGSSHATACDHGRIIAVMFSDQDGDGN